MTDDELILSLAQKRYRSLYCQLMAYAKTTGLEELYSDVEDCIQEAFLLLYDDLNRLRNHKNLDGWLFLTAQHLLLHSMGRAKTRRKHSAGSIDDELWHQHQAVKQINEKTLSEYQAEQSTEEMLNQVKDLIGAEDYAFLLDYFSKKSTAKTMGRKYGMSETNVWKHCQRLMQKIGKPTFII